MHNPTVKLWTRHLQYVPLVGIAVLLVSTFRLYESAYFWLDDLTSLFWVQQTSVIDMLTALVNPATHYFRPAGMLFYWIGLRLFGTNALPYHVLAWLIHTVNTALVYLVVMRITRSRSGAAVGAMLFASQAVFSHIYWNFGTIFELVGGSLFFLGILLWSSEQRSWAKVVLLSWVFILAVKGKEMAISLPAIWLVYDLAVRTNLKWRHAVQVVLPGSVAALLMLKALAEGRSTAADAPYYMDITGLTLGRGFGTYLNMLFSAGIRWQVWSVGFVALLILMALLKMRRAIFFHLWVFTTFLPVVFLTNHRYTFYWYIPFLGVCGLTALLVREIIRRLQPLMPFPIGEIAASLCFLLLCQITFTVQESQTAKLRIQQHEINGEFRGLIQALQELPPLPSNEILFIASAPSYFDEEHLTSAAQMLLKRTDITARMVEQFPVEARYRLRFENSRLYRITDSK